MSKNYEMKENLSLTGRPTSAWKTLSGCHMIYMYAKHGSISVAALIVELLYLPEQGLLECTLLVPIMFRQNRHISVVISWGVGSFYSSWRVCCCCLLLRLCLAALQVGTMGSTLMLTLVRDQHRSKLVSREQQHLHSPRACDAEVAQKDSVLQTKSRPRTILWHLFNRRR